MPKPARLIAAIGLHGSASTWAFNVLRELVEAQVGQEAVLSFFADRLDQTPDAGARDGRWVVFKSHAGEPQLDDWLQAQEARLVLSVRDPRDACLSMMQRFQMTLDQSAACLAMDCRRMMRLADGGHLLIRYEARPFDDPAAVTMLAAWVGLNPDPAVAADVFNRYRTEAVRDFAARLETLPPERLAGGAFEMDKVTRILAPHIGDARSGKWRDMTPPVRDGLTRYFEPFLDRFDYPR